MKPGILIAVLTLATAVAAGNWLALPKPKNESPPVAAAGDDVMLEFEPVAESSPIDVKSSQPDSDTEFVHGIRVRKNRNCTVELRYLDVGNGTVIEAHSCTPNQPREPGVFDGYDDATLAGMAYADPSAAEVLGKRLAEDHPEMARSFMLRSVALKPQNTHPLLWLASENYSLVATNGEPAITEMSENYLLARVAEELGTPGAATSIRDNLMSVGFHEEDFLKLEKGVIADLEVIRDIQLEVNGRSDLPEVSL
jgi:hypothetical protein